jgi:hypothetical protein
LTLAYHVALSVVVERSYSMAALWLERLSFDERERRHGCEFVAKTCVLLRRSSCDPRAARGTAGGKMQLSARILLGLISLCVASCAPPVSEIGPIFRYPAPVFGRSCEELADARARLTQKVIFATLYQDSLYQADRTTTLGIPTPLGAPFEENREVELGLLKGELVQLNAKIREKHCDASK